MLKKNFTIVFLSCLITGNAQASYQLPKFNFYNKPQKRVLRPYEAPLSNTYNGYSKVISTRRIRYGWYGNIGSSVHLPLPAVFLTRACSVPAEDLAPKNNDNIASTSRKVGMRSKWRSKKLPDIKPVVEQAIQITPYPSSAIPFDWSVSEKEALKDTIFVTKYWFPVDIQLGYRFSKNFSIEAALLSSMLSSDTQAKSMLFLPNGAIKMIIPYNAKSEFFCKIGAIGAISHIQKTKRAYVSNKNKNLAPKNQEIRYHAPQWSHNATWIVALGTDFKLNSKLNIHASLNGMGALKAKERRRSTTNAIDFYQYPVFIKVRIDYKYL